MLWIIFMLHSHQLPMPLSALSVCPRWCRDTTAGSPCLRGAFTCVNKLSLGSSDMTWEICILSNKDQLWLGLIFQWSALKLISICRPDEFREQMAPWFVLGIHLRVWGTWRGWNMGLFFHLCNDRVLRPCRRSKAFSHPLACASASVQKGGAFLSRHGCPLPFASHQKSMNIQWSNNKQALWGHQPNLYLLPLFWHIFGDLS